MRWDKISDFVKSRDGGVLSLLVRKWCQKRSTERVQPGTRMLIKLAARYNPPC